MKVDLESIEKIKHNIKSSILDEDIKNNLLKSLLDLESNLLIQSDTENEYSKSHITFDTYITRKKMLTSEQIRIKDKIQNILIKDIETIIEGKKKGILSRLRSSIDENASWISILLSITQLILP